jgi:hypothetical protein
MADKTRSARDAFGFSLRGLKASAMAAAGMAIGDDGINAALDERFKRQRQAPEQRPAADGG